ncbi:uncharacterized protein TNCV_1951811 [Trichonephila clavipes]|nr:uncharacterized protein TNCV_1951811 [Trichonephila clavipes]
MITNFFIPELNNHDVQELWFQQDGATCHTARATIDLLKDTFGDRLISRFGSVNWPPRCCDLTPLDYFLWGYVKSLVYANKPQTLDHLEDNLLCLRNAMLIKTPSINHIYNSSYYYSLQKYSSHQLIVKNFESNTYLIVSKHLINVLKTNETLGIAAITEAGKTTHSTTRLPELLGDDGSLAVTVSSTFPACHEFELFAPEDLLCRGHHCMLNLLRLKSPPVGVVGKLREGGAYQLMCRPSHVTMVQNYKVRRI